jgi:integrase
LYQFQIARWIAAPVVLPGPSPRVLTLGDMALSRLAVSLIADWHAGVVATAAKGRARQIGRLGRSKTVTDAQAARVWAKAGGYEVATSGRLSPLVVDAWHDAGAPRPLTAKPEVPRDAGRTAGARAYGFLRLVLNNAKREGLIPANPADVPGAGTTHPGERVPATVEQVATIAAAMPARYAAAVTVAAWGALRAGEVFALQRRHVTLTHDAAGSVTGAAVRIEQAQERTRADGLRVGPPKTRGSRRTVHLPTVAARALANHLDEFTGPSPDAFVFTSASGLMVDEATRTRFFGKARIAAGRPDLRFHDLRHTGATLATLAGAGIRDVMRRLGHTTPRAALIY